MKNFFILILLLAVIFTLLPNFSTVNAEEGWKGFVPCERADGSDARKCTFKDLLKMINIVVNYIFASLILPIAAIMFAYAGFLYSFTSISDEKSKARGIFINVVKGLILASAAWLIVKTLLNILGFKGDWIGF